MIMEARLFTRLILSFLLLSQIILSATSANAQEGKSGTDSLNVKTTEVSRQAALPSDRALPVQTQINTIADVSLRIGNIGYYYFRNEITYNNEKYLFFRADNNQPVTELRIFPELAGKPIEGLRLLSSADFEILDSLIFINNEHYRARIRFHNLWQSANPALILRSPTAESGYLNREIKLFPYFIVSLFHDGETIELFQGEEKIIEIPGNNLFNIYTDGEWNTRQDFQYRMTQSGNNLRIIIKAQATGEQTLSIPLQTIQPFIDNNEMLSFTPQPLELKFNVKPSRMHFININREVIFFETDRRRSQEITLDYHPQFQLRRTYRIEDRQDAGGVLIAEIYIKSFTTDNRVLADLTTYEYHRASDGYLYIKEGSRTLFMTNFSVINKPQITGIEILREGSDWTKSLNVHPGEKIEVKIEGIGLMDVDIRFDGCRQQQDSIRKSDRALFYEVRIPVDIPRRKIMIFMNREITQHELLVREYQRPAPLDFVFVNYGEQDIAVTHETFTKPVFYSKTIKDINIIFDPSRIDRNNRLFGKQHLSIEVRILDDQNRLLDLQTINNIIICPDESSPRHAHYGESDCSPLVISLNDHLLRKTYRLEAFSQVVITVRHNENRYNSPGHSQRMNIFVERRSSFDIQVSFPAGLLVKEFNQPGIGNLSGISTSVLAEISFYDKQRIGTKRPYKFGAGFIALNAFNFSESQNIKRDIGLVAITAIEPMRSGAKFSVPIYFGIGYLLKENDMFAIFGPGIRLHF
jgi:hypothetical protein